MKWRGSLWFYMLQLECLESGKTLLPGRQADLLLGFAARSSAHALLHAGSRTSQYGCFLLLGYHPLSGALDLFLILQDCQPLPIQFHTI